MYTGTKVGAMGDNATVDTVNFNESSAPVAPDVDLKALAEELARLRPEARKKASDPEHDDAIAALGKAEAAAKQGDAAGALSWLKGAGNWAAKVATEFSATLVAKLIERQIGG
jgi:hypothetical protein